MNQNVERFGNVGRNDRLALDDGLVCQHSSFDIVGFYGQHFLQGVWRGISFERPDLHFAESLAPELCLAAQRLLRNQRVRSGGSGVHFVFRQVDQLHHVDVADGDWLVESLTSASVDESLLAKDWRGVTAFAIEAARNGH